MGNRIGVWRMTFDEILHSIPEQELLSYVVRADWGTDRKAFDSHLMTPDEQKLNLVFYAKAAREHVGWDGFSEENRRAFEENIVALYDGISGLQRQDEFMTNLFNRTGQYIEDRHFALYTGKNGLSGGGEKEERSVGRNLAKHENKPQGYECLGKETATDWNGNSFVLWEIGTMKSPTGEDVLVVSLPNFADKGNNYEDWAGFIEKFDEVYLEQKEKWEAGRIVLDVRNNRGGEDKPIDHMAKRLYGNMINTYKRCEIRDTPFTNAMLHTHGMYSDSALAASGITREGLVDRKCFSGKNQTIFDETAVYYPFNPEQGYKGRIDILIDRDVGSAAESAYTSFYHHPNVRYVGENTAGMQQFTQGTFNMPCGYMLRSGVTKLTYWDKTGENIEVKGHRPDVNCSGEDAFIHVMRIGRDDGRVMGFREMNEPANGERRVVEYNPHATSDTRKAYYASAMEPALRQVEANNIAVLGKARQQMQQR